MPRSPNKRWSPVTRSRREAIQQEPTDFLPIYALAVELGHPTDHATALERLIRYGRRAVPALIALLSSQPRRSTYLYDGKIARRTAVEGLAHLKSRDAVAALIAVLNDKDEELRALAIWALGEIGDARAVPALIPLLGEQTVPGHLKFALREKRLKQGKPTIASLVANTLCKLGKEELVRAFFHSLEGNDDSLATLRDHRAEIVAALIKALDNPHFSRAANAARVIGELGAMEALPALRVKVRRFSNAHPSVKNACREAVSKLAAQVNLPTPANSPYKPSDTLPRVMPADDNKVETLPRVMTK